MFKLISKLLDATNSLPQIFGFEGRQNASYTYKTTHFWYRELWHFWGGTLVGAIGLILASFTWHWVHFIPIALIIIGECIKEAFEDINDGQNTVKTVLDTTAWALGAFYTLLPWGFILVPTAVLSCFAFYFRLKYGDCRFPQQKQLWDEILTKLKLK